MQNFSSSPYEILKSLRRNFSLIKTLTKREVLSRYKGSVFGIFWSFFNPVLMLFVYTFVFSVVLKVRWDNGSDSKIEFALLIFLGLLVFNFFSECIIRAPSLILNNPNYVKKIIFPLEILPWVSIGNSLFHFLIGISIWIFAYCIFIGFPQLTILFFPFILLPLIFLIIGLSWLLASMSLFLRDISHIIAVIVNILMFGSPIFYSTSLLPDRLQFIFSINPLAQSIGAMRDILYWGVLPNYLPYLIYLFFSVVIAYFGFAWFQVTRKDFADVI
jgi:lipopolysaccharide transport system permease protein